VSRVTLGVSPECLCHDVRDNVRRVHALEEAGFDYVWEGDHTLPWHHSRGHSAGIFTTLAAYLAVTERCVVGGMVIPPIGLRHHPVDVAIEIATQALLFPGRVALCVGTGEAMNERTTTGSWPPLRERIARLIEAIGLIEKAWRSDDYFHHRGRYFDSFFRLYTRPPTPIPLLCAANGPQMARNAGYYTSGYVAVGVSPDYHRDVLIPAFELGAREAGKDPNRLLRCAWVSTAYHPDASRALEAARLYGGQRHPGPAGHREPLLAHSGRGPPRGVLHRVQRRGDHAALRGLHRSRLQPRHLGGHESRPGSGGRRRARGTPRAPPEARGPEARVTCHGQCPRGGEQRWLTSGWRD
jgi:G6PDH family F420-dependent oxidoreductase